MGFTVDFSEFDKLKKSYESLEKDFNKFLYSFLIEMAERIIAKTKLKTPVDTGALRNAWAVETDKVTAKTEMRTSKRTGKLKETTSYTQEGKIITSGSGKELTVILSNPMEYATDIEYGHRIVSGSGENKTEIGWYNGHFMLKTSIDEIEKQMPLRFEREFKAFCKAHGIDS